MLTITTFYNYSSLLLLNIVDVEMNFVGWIVPSITIGPLREIIQAGNYGIWKHERLLTFQYMEGMNQGGLMSRK